MILLRALLAFVVFIGQFCSTEFSGFRADGEFIRLDHPRMRAEFNSAADLVWLSLESTRYTKEVVPRAVTFKDSAASPFVAGRMSGIRFGFLGKTQDQFTVVSRSVAEDGQSFTVILEDRQEDSISRGLILHKEWTLQGEYRLKLKLRVSNPLQNPLPLHPSTNASRVPGLIFGIVTPEDYWATHEGGKGLEIEALNASGSFGPAAVHGMDTIAWRNQHFVLASKFSHLETVFVSTTPLAQSTGTVQKNLLTHLLPLGEEQLAAAASLEREYSFFFGEKREEVMVETEFSSLFNRYGAILGGIQKLMFATLQFFFGLTGDWGFAIILLTALVKLILLPLNIKQTMSMAKMQMIQPELKALQEKFADDRQRLSMEMMKLYQTHQINPLSGCLPMLLQMPVFLALFYTVGGSVEILGSSFYWIPDLASEDPLKVLPAIFTLSFILTQRKMTVDPSQKALIYLMPVMLFVMMMHLPAGVMLYIVGQSLFSNIEQAFIRPKSATQEVVAEVIAPSKSKKRKG